jgi:hypothetical protein
MIVKYEHVIVFDESAVFNLKRLWLGLALDLAKYEH